MKTFAFQKFRPELLDHLRNRSWIADKILRISVEQNDFMKKIYKNEDIEIQYHELLLNLRILPYIFGDIDETSLC